MKGKHKQTFTTTISAMGDEPCVTISTPKPDRDGDVLVMSGCILDNYRKNPAVLYGHDVGALPVGAATSIEVEASGITARWRWLQGDEFADRVKNAWDQKILNAASVGFIPTESRPRKDGRGLEFMRWELLEFSIVPLPSNPDATRQLKAMGLWSPSPEHTKRALQQLDRDHLSGAVAHLSEVLAALDADESEDVLDVIDDEEQDAAGDEEIDIDAEDLKAAIQQVTREVTRGMVEREVTSYLQSRFANQMLDGITAADVRNALPGVIRAAFKSEMGAVVAREVSTAIRKHRGRLD